MKNIFYVLTALLMVSCGSNSLKSKYGETITSYLLRGKTASDYNFKIEELTEQGTLTVSDSIAYLTDEFRKDKQLIINRFSLAKEMSETLLEKTKNQKYEAEIAKINRGIDSLKNLPPDNLKGYEGRNTSDILSVIIRCRYSIQLPGSFPVIETFDFFLSPDGSKCYRKTRVE